MARLTGAIRAAIYRRMSRGKDTDDWKAQQLKDGLAIAERMGGTVAPEDVYTDIVSASRFSKKEREDYQRLLRAIQQPDGPKIVVCWMEDRAHRQILELAEFIDICREHNVRPATPNAEYDLDDPDQLTMWYMKVRFAEAEVEKMAKRLRRQRLHAAEQGLPHLGAHRHFGFQRWTKRDGLIVPDNAVPASRIMQEREWAREAVARLKAGDSVRGIVSDWNRRGIKTARGAAWSPASLRAMITSPTLAGYRGHHGDRYEATWAPIVDRDDWEAVQAILADPARRTTLPGRAPVYLLTGVIWCGVCGKRMRGMPVAKTGQTVYRCVNYLPDAPALRPSRRHVLVEKEVKKRLFYRVQRSQQFADAAGRPDDDPTKPLYAELARLQAKYDRVGEAEIDRLADDEELDEATKKQLLRVAERKRTKIEQEMDKLRTRLDMLDGARVRAHIPPNLPEIWDDLTLDRQRAILQSMIDYVIVLPANNHGRNEFDPDSIVCIWRGWRRWPEGVVMPEPVRARVDRS